MSGLVHYYFGDRLKAFEIGLGTIIRSEGHSLKTLLIVFNDNYSWVRNLDDHNQFEIQIIDKTELIKLGLNPFKDLFSTTNKTIVVANVDLFLQFSQIPINDFIETIEQIKSENEIILTGEKMSEKLVQIADYVSELLLS